MHPENVIGFANVPGASGPRHSVGRIIENEVAIVLHVQVVRTSPSIPSLGSPKNIAVGIVDDEVSIRLHFCFAQPVGRNKRALEGVTSGIKANIIPAGHAGVALARIGISGAGKMKLSRWSSSWRISLFK